MKAWKAKFICGIMAILLTILACDVIAVVPKSLPWILAPFAAVGAWQFIKILFIWLTVDDDAPLFKPRKHKKGKVDWSKVWAGEAEE